MTIPFVAMDPW
jgi:hypothetical protein